MRTRLLGLSLGLLLLALTGGAGYLIYCQLWASYHYRAAEKALEQRDFELAQAHLALCLEVRSRDAEAHFLAARTARRAGDYDDAERHLAACKRLDWVPEAIALERALLEAQQADPTKVEGYLLACVRKDHPDTVLILEALAQGYLKTYHLPQALDCLNQWLARDADDVQALLWRGEVRERLHNANPALDDYRRGLDLDPERDDARLRLAKLLVEQQRYGEARGHFAQLVERQPGNAEAMLGLARCAHALGDAQEARRLLDQLLGSQPRNAGALTERGKLSQEADQLADAEEWLRRAVTVAPYEREAVYAFIQCLRQRGKHDEARPWSERLDRAQADLKRIADVTRQIVREPRDPALRSEAGRLLLRNGQEQEGLRWLDSALQLDPANRAAHQALADHLERQGHTAQAARHRQFLR